MNTSPPNTHAAASLRDLPLSLPYTRLFGPAPFFLDDTSPLRRAGRREREQDRR